MVWRRVFGERKKLLPEVREEDSGEPKFRDEDIPGVIDLGLYYSENKNEVQVAKVSRDDRAIHCYVVGATCTGKTKFLEHLILQDICQEQGFGVIDPHGDLVEDVKCFLAWRARENDEPELLSDFVVLIDPTDPKNTVTFNPLEKLPGISIPEQVNELISAFRRIWAESWGVRMEDLMRNSLIALGEAEMTLCELAPFLTERAFRAAVLEKVAHPVAKEYFKRFDTLTDRAQIAWIEPVMNKVNAFFSDDRVRQMFSSPKSSFNLREVMDFRKILLINLDEGRLVGSSALLGSLLMAKIQMAAFSRSDLPRGQRTPFYLYIDEFQNFASDSFAVILSEARKYGLSLTLAHQTLAQLPGDLRSLVLGNTGLQVYFRINRQDSQLLAKEAFNYSGFTVKSSGPKGDRYWSLGEEWEKHIGELQSLEPRCCYVKHKIRGGVIPVRTMDIEPAHEFLGMKEDECREFLRALPIGAKYRVDRQALAAALEERQGILRQALEQKGAVKAAPERVEAGVEEKKRPEEAVEAAPAREAKKERKKAEPEELAGEREFLELVARRPGTFVTAIYRELGLSGYRGDRIKKALIEKEKIRQEETRAGEKGRLARALYPIGKLAAEAEPVGAGKGGDKHRQLQASLKEQAELFGWKGRVEEKIPGSQETVDLGLRRDDLRAAVEISDTSRAAYEAANVRKCLEAGYDYVVLVCAESRRLARLRTEVRKGFSFKERERIRFCLPRGFRDFLAAVSPGIVSEKPIVSGQFSSEKQLLSTTETAELLGISRNTLYDWIVQKKIPCVKVGRLVKFRRTDLEAWLEKRRRGEDRNFL